MSEKFFSLSPDEQSALTKKAADQIGLPEIIIEKDIWVCWLLDRIFSLPEQMAFKGGTSLSKVFGLIKRFSEDCDITVDYHNFKPKLNLKNATRSQLKKASDELKSKLQHYIANTVLPFLKSEIAKTFSKKLFEITLSDDGEQLRFYYPSVVSHSTGYLRDHVFIEFGVRNSTEPCEKHVIEPYLAQVMKIDLQLPKATVNTLSPIRTYFEKATLIHVECHRDRMIQTPERLSRHWYDLFMLNNSWVGKKVLNHAKILKSVIEHKKAFFHYSYANYDDCLIGKFRLMPEEHYLKSLRQDYTKMINAGMFHDSPPKFDEMIRVLSHLEKRINSKRW
ncbi:MAG: hypothetical protein A3F17_07110 [Gammaproteobacteria bacterium RIFCSPHIGHO2_12_FULL_41_15]|nr:MAG: hypothetical protein A3F17_07110 [Gammaproteobacteria bacterium RIFCSPHIGHO2_12_FULL_41_15]